jgi:hypothetical protein
MTKYITIFGQNFELPSIVLLRFFHISALTKSISFFIFVKANEMSRALIFFFSKKKIGHFHRAKLKSVIRGLQQKACNVYYGEF